MDAALEIDALRRELLMLESGAGEALSDSDLAKAIQRIHMGFRFSAPVFEPGILLWRMVLVDSLPTRRERVSYPPMARVSTYGRANRPGEVMFYAALDHLVPCFFECEMRQNAFYCASAWRSTAPIMCSHLGYSEKTLEDSVIERPTPKWIAVDNDNERNHLIRQWQARLFTRQVRKGSEYLYRIGLALRQFAMCKIENITVRGLNSFDGLVYPSVASTNAFDNVALLPDSVDKKLKLVEVRLLSLRSVDGCSVVSARAQFNAKITDYDCAVPDSDGNLIWGSCRQFDMEQLLSNG